jgi:predicted RND superfamily exporter protein
VPTPDLGRKQGLLLRVERFSREHWRMVFLLAALAIVVGFGLSSVLKLESDVLALIPRGNPKIDTFKAALEDFGSFDLLLVLLEAEGEAGPEELEDFADRYAGRLEGLSREISWVEYKIAPDDALFDLLSRNALLFVPPEQMATLAERLSDAGIRRKIRENAEAMASPASPLSGEAIAADPLELRTLFLQRLAERRKALKVDLSDGYYMARDGRSLILLAKPVRPSQNLDFNRRLMAAVQWEAEAARGETEGGQNIRVRFGGNYALVLQETELVRRSLIFNAVVSLLAVLGLYYVCYRRVAALLYSSLPLIAGQALTFAVAYFALDRMSAISVAFTALLMGLGTDFTIVMYARYIEERHAGASLAVATERMVGETGIGVFTGVITSAGTFYAMCLSSFRGLWDFGFLMGTGILLCGLAIVTMLPAMITWNEGVRRRKVDSLQKLHLQSFGLERLIPWAVRHRTAVLMLVTVLTLAGIWFGRRLDFDDSVQALRSNDTEAAQVQAKVADTFGAALSPMMAIASGRSVEEALERSAVIAERLRPKVEDGTLASFDSVLTYLPTMSRQRQVIETVRARADGAFDPARVRATLTDALESEGFQSHAFEPAMARLTAMLTPERPVTLEEVEGQGLRQLLSRYVHREENGTVRVVTYLFPADIQWRRRPPPGLIESIERGEPGIVATGSNVAAQELRTIFVRDALRAVVAGLVLVFGLLLADFRSLRLAAIVMAQVLSAVAMMFGLMWAAGMQINSANAFVATMILGVGIDYGIHIAHRLEHMGGRIEPGLLETGKAVVLAAFTNIAGFGTLVLGHYPAMRSFGLVALFGSATSLFTALVLVPALLGKREPRS